jgi:hypothetical protein
MSRIDEIHKIVSKPTNLTKEDEESILILISDIKDLSTNMSVLEALKYINSSSIEMENAFKIINIDYEFAWGDDKIRLMIKNIFDKHKIPYEKKIISIEIENALLLYNEYYIKFYTPFICQTEKYYSDNFISKFYFSLNKDYLSYVAKFHEIISEPIERVKQIISKLHAQPQNNDDIFFLYAFRGLLDAMDNYNIHITETINARISYKSGLIPKENITHLERRKEQDFFRVKASMSTLLKEKHKISLD